MGHGSSAAPPLAGPEPTETKPCSLCRKALSKERFANKQWKKLEGGRCIECSAAVAPIGEADGRPDPAPPQEKPEKTDAKPAKPDATKACSSCLRMLPRKQFAAHQWKKEGARCRDCAEAGGEGPNPDEGLSDVAAPSGGTGGAPQALKRACAGCGSSYGPSRFIASEWNSSAPKCYSCRARPGDELLESSLEQRECVTCEQSYLRESFNKREWKKTAGECASPASLLRKLAGPTLLSLRLLQNRSLWRWSRQQSDESARAAATRLSGTASASASGRRRQGERASPASLLRKLAGPTQLLQNLSLRLSSRLSLQRSATVLNVDPPSVGMASASANGRARAHACKLPGRPLSATSEATPGYASIDVPSQHVQVGLQHPAPSPHNVGRQPFVANMSSFTAVAPSQPGTSSFDPWSSGVWTLPSAASSGAFDQPSVGAGDMEYQAKELMICSVCLEQKDKEEDYEFLERKKQEHRRCIACVARADRQGLNAGGPILASPPHAFPASRAPRFSSAFPPRFWVVSKSPTCCRAELLRCCHCAARLLAARCSHCAAWLLASHCSHWSARLLVSSCV